MICLFTINIYIYIYIYTRLNNVNAILDVSYFMLCDLYAGRLVINIACLSYCYTHIYNILYYAYIFMKNLF